MVTSTHLVIMAAAVTCCVLLLTPRLSTAAPVAAKHHHNKRQFINMDSANSNGDNSNSFINSRNYIGGPSMQISKWSGPFFNDDEQKSAYQKLVNNGEDTSGDKRDMLLGSIDAEKILNPLPEKPVRRRIVKDDAPEAETYIGANPDAEKEIVISPQERLASLVSKPIIHDDVDDHVREETKRRSHHHHGGVSHNRFNENDGDSYQRRAPTKEYMFHHGREGEHEEDERNPQIREDGDRRGLESNKRDGEGEEERGEERAPVSEDPSPQRFRNEERDDGPVDKPTREEEHRSFHDEEQENEHRSGRFSDESSSPRNGGGAESRAAGDFSGDQGGNDSEKRSSIHKNKKSGKKHKSAAKKAAAPKSKPAASADATDSKAAKKSEPGSSISLNVGAASVAKGVSVSSGSKASKKGGIYTSMGSSVPEGMISGGLPDSTFQGHTSTTGQLPSASPHQLPAIDMPLLSATSGEGNIPMDGITPLTMSGVALNSHSGVEELSRDPKVKSILQADAAMSSLEATDMNYAATGNSHHGAALTDTMQEGVREMEGGEHGDQMMMPRIEKSHNYQGEARRTTPDERISYPTLAHLETSGNPLSDVNLQNPVSDLNLGNGALEAHGMSPASRDTANFMQGIQAKSSQSVPFAGGISPISNGGEGSNNDNSTPEAIFVHHQGEEKSAETSIKVTSETAHKREHKGKTPKKTSSKKTDKKQRKRTKRTKRGSKKSYVRVVKKSTTPEKAKDDKNNKRFYGSTEHQGGFLEENTANEIDTRLGSYDEPHLMTIGSHDSAHDVHKEWNNMHSPGNGYYVGAGVGPARTNEGEYIHHNQDVSEEGQHNDAFGAFGNGNGMRGGHAFGGNHAGGEGGRYGGQIGVGGNFGGHNGGGGGGGDGVGGFTGGFGGFGGGGVGGGGIGGGLGAWAAAGGAGVGGGVMGGGAEATGGVGSPDHETADIIDAIVTHDYGDEHIGHGHRHGADAGTMNFFGNHGDDTMLNSETLDGIAEHWEHGGHHGGGGGEETPWGGDDGGVGATVSGHEGVGLPIYDHHDIGMYGHSLHGGQHVGGHAGHSSGGFEGHHIGGHHGGHGGHHRGMHGVGLHGGGHIGGSDGYGGHGAEEGTASITPPDVHHHEDMSPAAYHHHLDELMHRYHHLEEDMRGQHGGIMDHLDEHLLHQHGHPHYHSGYDLYAYKNPWDNARLPYHVPVENHPMGDEEPAPAGGSMEIGGKDDGKGEEKGGPLVEAKPDSPASKPPPKKEEKKKEDKKEEKEDEKEPGKSGPEIHKGPDWTGMPPKIPSSRGGPEDSGSVGLTAGQTLPSSFGKDGSAAAMVDAYNNMKLDVPAAMQIQVLKEKLKAAEEKNKELVKVVSSVKETKDEAPAKDTASALATLAAAAAAAAAPQPSTALAAAKQINKIDFETLVSTPSKDGSTSLITGATDLSKQAPKVEPASAKTKAEAAPATAGAGDVTKLIQEMGTNAAKVSSAGAQNFNQLQNLNLIQQSLLKNMLMNTAAINKPGDATADPTLPTSVAAPAAVALAPETVPPAPENAAKVQEPAPAAAVASNAATAEPITAAVQQTLGSQPADQLKQLQLLQGMLKGMQGVNPAETPSTATAGADAAGITKTPSTIADAEARSKSKTSANKTAVEKASKDKDDDDDDKKDSATASVSSAPTLAASSLLANMLMQQKAAATAALAPSVTTAVNTPVPAAPAAAAAPALAKHNPLTPEAAEDDETGDDATSLLGSSSKYEDKSDDGGLVSLLNSAGVVPKKKHHKRHHKKQKDPYAKIGYESAGNGDGYKVTEALSKRHEQVKQSTAASLLEDKTSSIEAAFKDDDADDDDAAKRKKNDIHKST